MLSSPTKDRHYETSKGAGRDVAGQPDDYQTFLRPVERKNCTEMSFFLSSPRRLLYSVLAIEFGQGLLLPNHVLKQFRERHLAQLDGPLDQVRDRAVRLQFAQARGRLRE